MRIPSMGGATITGLTRPWRGLLIPEEAAPLFRDNVAPL